eukprot:scaffold93705_cov19-Tisochrysis_lutea.AAC.2
MQRVEHKAPTASLGMYAVCMTHTHLCPTSCDMYRRPPPFLCRCLQSSLRQKEAVLAEAVTSHNAQLEMWRAEATDVAQAASKWKQRALLLQQQVWSVARARCTCVCLCVGGGGSPSAAAPPAHALEMSGAAEELVLWRCAQCF